MRTLPALLLATLALTSPALAVDDHGTWHAGRLRLGRLGAWEPSAGGELRFIDDSSYLEFARLSAQFRHAGEGPWTWNLNLSHIVQRAETRSDIANLRAELGGTRRFELRGNRTASLRSRVELWWREGAVDEDARLRLLPRIDVALDRGRLRGFWASNEGFWSHAQGRFFQNRLIPAALRYDFGRAKASFYLMLLSQRGAADWAHSLVLGQSWSF